MKKFLGLFSLFLILGLGSLAGATTVTLLDDYQTTNDNNDLILIGDPTPLVAGPSHTFNFDLSGEPLTGGKLTISIDHQGVNLNHPAAHHNYVYLNGTSLGFLSDSHTLDLTIYKTTIFNGSNNLLKRVDNTLTIASSIDWPHSGYYDDFQITNVFLDYEPVPVPATIVLLGFGLVGLAGVSRRK